MNDHGDHGHFCSRKSRIPDGSPVVRFRGAWMRTAIIGYSGSMVGCRVWSGSCVNSGSLSVWWRSRIGMLKVQEDRRQLKT